MLDGVAQSIAEEHQIGITVEQTHAEPNGRYFITIDPKVFGEPTAELNGLTIDQAMWALEGIAAGAQVLWAKWRWTL